MLYEIWVEGHLDERWQSMFEEFRITHAFSTEQQPVTIMVGAVPDQAALYGALSRLRDVGATLVQVQRVVCK